MIEGLLNFQIRGEDPGVSAAYPYYRGDADAASLYLDGTPLIVSSGNTVAIAATISGVITSTKILGFCATPDHDPTLGVEFPQMPYIKDRNNRQQVMVYRANGWREYSAAIASGQTLVESLIGTKCSFRQQGGTNQYVIDPTATANQLITITGVFTEDLGKLGGRVYFRVPGANSSFETP